MNRYDQIQGLARDIASNVHADPANRDAMADSLIQLCTAVVAAIGKGVAVKGESDLRFCNDPNCDCQLNGCDREADKTHGMYLTGEAIQDVADSVAGHSLNPQVDLDRWDPPVWQHTDRRPAMFRDADERGVAFIPPGMQASGRGDVRPPVSPRGVCTCSVRVATDGTVTLEVNPDCPRDGGLSVDPWPGGRCPRCPVCKSDDGHSGGCAIGVQETIILRAQHEIYHLRKDASS